MVDQKPDPAMAEALRERRPGESLVTRDYTLPTGRRATIAYPSSLDISGELVADLRTARSEGATAVLVVTGGGGRTAIGSILARLALVRLELRDAGEADAAAQLEVEWLRPGRGRSTLRWAQRVGIGTGGVASAAEVKAHAWAGTSWDHVCRGDDLLLHAYWQREGGTLWREVPIAEKRRIDGVLIPGGKARVGIGPVQWNDPGLQVIEAKFELNSKVIGQAIGAREAAAEHGAMDPQAVALVKHVEPRERPLVRVCGELGVDLVADLRPSEVITVALQPDDPMLAWLRHLTEVDELSGPADALMQIVRRAMPETAEEASLR